MKPEAEILVVGSPPRCSMIVACRDDSNRHVVDELVLPQDSAIESPDEDLRPHHPMVVIRCYSSIEMILSPERLRAMSQWLLQASEWLEDAIDDAAEDDE